MKIIIGLVLCLNVMVAPGQILKSFSVTMKPDSLCFLSMKNGKAFTAAVATRQKTEMDFGLFATTSEGITTLEWYNLSGKDDKPPVAVQGTASKIVAIGFDRDQFDKCKTAADLKRMTGYLTANSFSHFAVISQGRDINQHCFLFEKTDGKRGLIYVYEMTGRQIKAVVKTQ